ncbi:MAG: hypothetical protein J5I92_15035 [Thiogranum sp.]|nr:hypothetical protein [Thiogranum sp.]
MAQIISFEAAQARRETLARAAQINLDAMRYPAGSYGRQLFQAFAKADFDACLRLMAEHGR